MNIVRLFYEGGLFFMLVITACWGLMLVFSAIKIVRMVKYKKFDLLLLDYILLFGSLSFMVGVLGLGIGLSSAMNAIQQAGDISVALVAGGIKVVLITPIYGLFLFLISLCIWGVLKEINKRKMMNELVESKPIS